MALLGMKQQPATVGSSGARPSPRLARPAVPRLQRRAALVVAASAAASCPGAASSSGRGAGASGPSGRRGAVGSAAPVMVAGPRAARRAALVLVCAAASSEPGVAAPPTPPPAASSKNSLQRHQADRNQPASPDNLYSPSISCPHGFVEAVMRKQARRLGGGGLEVGRPMFCCLEAHDLPPGG